ncbi:MAG TPA: TonB-dependent receptor, partial [Thermomonas sp.]|nr:TonB-dependent receptor [Thermomonas sp.]
VWAPTAKFSVSADYHHWDIRDEVRLQSVDQLMRDEAACRTGGLDINSGTCQAAISQITRGSAGTVQSIEVKKINIAKQTLDAVTVDMNYRQELGAFGTLGLSGSWTRNLEHLLQDYPTDPVVDALNDPYWSTDPKYKANASVSWNKARWTTTLYANYIGPTPNYRATLDPDGYAFAGAGRLGSYTTANASVNFDVTEDLKLSFLVNNLANRMPDMDVRSYPGNSGEPYNSSNFNLLGRAYYVEAKWNFGKGK